MDKTRPFSGELTPDLNSVNVLVSYVNVIRAPELYILHLIQTKWRNKFKDSVDFESIDTLTHEALLFAWANRPYGNVLEWITLAGKYYDFETTYANLSKKLDFLYRDAELLRFDTVVKNYANHPKFDNVYLWSPTYDKRIHDDIKERYSDYPSIKYVTGVNLEKVLDTVAPIHMAYVADAAAIKDIAPKEKFKGTIFGVAAYGWNYSYDFDDGTFGKLKYHLEDCGNVSTFPPIATSVNALFYG
nr:MAG TPA: hypothetical protein [Caudoviricetes sp.]